jgi:hypothetical protein
MFWKLFVVGFMMDRRTLHYVSKLKLSTIIIPPFPNEDGKDFLKKITTKPEDDITLEDILEKRSMFKRQYSEKSGYDERYGNDTDDIVLNITEFFHKMNLLRTLERVDVSQIDKMAAIDTYEKDTSNSYSVQIEKGGLMNDWNMEI